MDIKTLEWLIKSIKPTEDGVRMAEDVMLTARNKSPENLNMAALLIARKLFPAGPRPKVDISSLDALYRDFHHVPECLAILNIYHHLKKCELLPWNGTEQKAADFIMSSSSESNITPKNILNILSGIGLRNNISIEFKRQLASQSLGM